MKIVFLDAQTVGDADVLHPIAALGQLVRYSATEPHERLAHAADANVLITNKVIIDKPLIDQLPALQLICISATGMNCVEVEYARSKGIVVKNVAGYSTHSVAQHTFAMLLSLMHCISNFDAYVKNGAYAQCAQFTHIQTHYFELSGKTFGIIGLGEIGRQVAQIATAFGAKVVYHSVSGKNMNQPYPHLSLHNLLSESDVVSIHAPLSDQTRNLISEKELKIMKATAFLINAGRGGIVNENDLAFAIDNKTIAGSATDVFEAEPIRTDSPFMQMKYPERMLFTPHVAWTSDEALATLIQKIANNIKVFCETGA